MALITDASFVIQKLRLTTLMVEGPMAERIIQISTQLAPEESSLTDNHMEFINNVHENAAQKRRNSKETRRQSRVPIKGKPEKQPKLSEYTPPEAPADGILFKKIDVKGANQPLQSALSKGIKQKSGHSNPFSQYSSFCGKGEGKPIRLKIWLPFSESKNKPMEIIVKADATVEDVIGYALYEYTDSGRMPRALENVTAYSLRIVEDDGNIDDDFPALERARKIEKFSFDQFALCEAPREQFMEQEAKKKEQQKEQKKSGQVFLRVHLYSTLEIKQTSTITVLADTLMSDLLKQLCEKHKLSMEEYTLRMVDTKTDIPMNKTVAEVSVFAVCLMKKDRHSAGDIYVRPAGERLEDDEVEVPEMLLNEFTIYKRYNVQRRMPMFGGKQDRILAIDGELIHIMPPESRGFFESHKTTSFHISSVSACELRSVGLLRIVYRKDNKEKIYDFETQLSEEAEEIISRINMLAEKLR